MQDNASSISDLFFNHGNENYNKLFEVSSYHPSTVEIENAIAADARHFSEHYFDLLSQTKDFQCEDKTSFAAWLKQDFLRRL